MSQSELLRTAVAGFVGQVSPLLQRLAEQSGVAAGKEAGDRLAGDVALEAYNLAAAFIDADGRQTDEELTAFIEVFGPRFDTVARAGGPAALRAAGILSGRRSFVERPSALFELLVDADAGDGGERSRRYYSAALEIGHTVLALDSFTSQAELSAIERFRGTLLERMDAAGVARPGWRGPAGAVPGAEGPGRAARVPADRAPDQASSPPRPLEELLAELDSLVGLGPVKAEVRSVTNLLRVEQLRRQRGLPVVEHSRHLVFTGNPGTGKTTVARLLGEIYRVLGVVGDGHLVETDRSGLVAGYVGQTATKVRKVFESALGGVLLIDEAHALARGVGTDFGHEAIDTIVKLMEDHRGEVVLVVAGYPEEMVALLDANPGLRSRFPKTIYFPDYSDEELARIFEGMCERNHYTPTREAIRAVLAHLQAQPRGRGFGNARLARNLFEASVARQASRVIALGPVPDDVLVRLEEVDITGAPVPDPASGGAGTPLSAPPPSPGPTP